MLPLAMHVSMLTGVDARSSAYSYFDIPGLLRLCYEGGCLKQMNAPLDFKMFFFHSVLSDKHHRSNELHPTIPPTDSTPAILQL